MGKNYIGNEDFVAKRQLENTFNPRPVDNQILQDPDPHYRVFDVSNGDPFNNASSSYFHKTIGGYSPAKLQRYEDIKNRYLSRNYQPVLNMLNAKYYITNGGTDGTPVVSRNPNAFGNAWCVLNVNFVKTPNEEIGMLEKVDLSNTAIIHEEFQTTIGKSSFSGQGNISLSDYSPNSIVYNFSSSADQLVVFSEVWYEPGWTATIDGKEADIVRVNYLLRGLLVPTGNHEIIFEFAPPSYFVGKTVSYISSLIIIIVMLGLAFYKFYWMDRRVKT
jgi:uncharacterized membrane protein YfhO